MVSVSTQTRLTCSEESPLGANQSPAYPPGVMNHWLVEDTLAGRVGSSDLADFIQISSLSGDEWVAEILDGGMIEELWKEIHGDVQDRINRVSWDLQYLDRFQDKSAYYVYPMKPVQGGGVLTLFDFSEFSLQDALWQFEEDFEYEKWLNDKEHIKAIKDYNRHTLLSCEEFEGRDGWAGEISSEKGWISGFAVDVGEYLVTERYNMGVEITNHSPNSNGYAKGTTEYGDVYIPAKFNKYLPPIGGISMMTLVPQVFDGEGKCIPWKCIFQHDGMYH